MELNESEFEEQRREEVEEKKRRRKGKKEEKKGREEVRKKETDVVCIPANARKKILGKFYQKMKSLNFFFFLLFVCLLHPNLYNKIANL